MRGLRCDERLRDQQYRIAAGGLLCFAEGSRDHAEKKAMGLPWARRMGMRLYEHVVRRGAGSLRYSESEQRRL